MTPSDRIRDALRPIQVAAANRWQARAGIRTETKATIAAHGAGSADSPARQAAFAERIGNFELLRAISPRDLPRRIERAIGPWDAVPTAPSVMARKAGRPVARIGQAARPGFEMQGLATGFLVAPDLLMTNWHVFPTRGDATGYAANFLYEREGDGISRGITFALEPARFFLSDERLDFAIVAVAPRNDTGDLLLDLGQITLIEARPKILKGHPVNIIQHPLGRPKEYAFTGNRLVDILETEGLLQYETDTEPGTSGAPAFNSQWELVALHHTAIPEMRDGVVLAVDGNPWREEMGDDRVRWVANEGVRVSAIVGALKQMTAATQEEARILKSLLHSTEDPLKLALDAIGHQPSYENRSTGAGDVVQTVLASLGQEGGMSGIQFTFTGPVTINVNQVAGAPAAVAAPAFVEKSIRFDPDYDGRKGYDPKFLDDAGDIIVPVPKVAKERRGEIYKDDNGDPLVLKYHHFELIMNRERRLQMWSAVNVDYAAARKVEGDRKSWGSDRWVADPRIPAAVQIFDADFYKPAGNIDRGHMVRREDNEWGDTALEIEFANSDTFHWTNCTPQHEAFNQSTPGQYNKTYQGMEGIWGAFENHVQKSRAADDTRASILAGPVLATQDPTADFGKGLIQYPIQFFKIVCVVDRSAGGRALRAFGFLLSQQDVVTKFGIERFGPGRFERYQVPLSEIEAAAGLIFDPVLHAADVMAGQAGRKVASTAEIVGIDKIGP